MSSAIAAPMFSSGGAATISPLKEARAGNLPGANGIEDLKTALNAGR